MLYDIQNGTTSNIFRVKLLNSSVTTGAGLQGLTSASTGLIISTIADNEVAAVAYTVAGSKVETIATLGTYASPTATKCRFKEVDATNHPGLYEVQIADARFAITNAKALTISFSGATNLAECDVVIPLRAIDPYNSVTGGISNITNLDAAVSSRSTYVGGDPWATVLPGGYGVGSAGAMLAGLDTDDTRADAVYPTGTVSASTSASSFTLVFSSTVVAANFVGLVVDFGAQLAAPSYQVVTTSTQVDSTHLLLTFAVPFSATPATNMVASIQPGYDARAFDSVVIETGLNARQAISEILAATTSIQTVPVGAGNVVGKNAAGVTRFTTAVDGTGNRTAVTYTPPA